MKISNFFVAAVLVLSFSCNHSPKNAASEVKPAPETVKESPKTPVDTSASVEIPREQLEHLKGKWQRTDGGYIMQIISLSDDGTMNAAYFNPKSIHVETAQWIYKGGIIYIRIILRDVNYPGSTYTLAFKAENDYFMGNYYQAVEGNNYDVIFTRKN